MSHVFRCACVHPQKGCGYHLDLFVVGVMLGVCSLMGLPWFVAATVLSISHVNSLKLESECSAPGEQPKFLGIREQRFTGLMIFVLMGSSVFMTSVLKVSDLLWSTDYSYKLLYIWENKKTFVGFYLLMVIILFLSAAYPDACVIRSFPLYGSVVSPGHTSTAITSHILCLTVVNFDICRCGLCVPVLFKYYLYK